LEVALHVPTPPENKIKLAVVFFHTLGSTSHREGHVSEQVTTYPLVENNGLLFAHMA